jgi:integrase
VRTFLEYWLEDVARPRVRTRTFESYSYLARKHIIPALGRVKLADLQAAHLQRLYRDLRVEGLSAATVQRVHAVLRSALRHAVDTGVVTRSVAQIVHPPTPEQGERTTLTPAQAKVLLAEASKTRHHALITVAVYCGLRQGELLGLRWADIDLDARTLRVRRQLSHDGTYNEPKTRAARRTIDWQHTSGPMVTWCSARAPESRSGTGT